MNEITQLEMAHLLRVSWIVLIPVGVLLALVLYKLAMLLHAVLDLLTIARYELTPAIKDLRIVAENAELLSSKAVASVRSAEENLQTTRSALRQAGQTVRLGLTSLLGGIRESFSRRS